MEEVKKFVKDQGFKETPFEHEFTMDSVFLYKVMTDYAEHVNKELKKEIERLEIEILHYSDKRYE